MAINFTIFDVATHKIIQGVSHIPHEGLPEGQDWISGDWDQRFYEVDPETLASYPAVQPLSHQELVRLVTKERARRLAAGFDFDFGDGRGTHRIATTDEDEKSWSRVSTLASALINASLPDGDIHITTETGPVTITAMEWQHILIAAGQFQQPIFQKSFALQAMDPIPQDVTDPAYWD